MSRKKIDNRKVSQDNFLSHLEKSATKVRSWPEWKQKSLDSPIYQDQAKCLSSASQKNK